MQTLKLSDTKNIIITLLTLAFAPVTMAEEMSVEDKIKSAMSAAPTRISASATILDSDGTVLRKGNNKWTCMLGGLPGSKKYPMVDNSGSDRFPGFARVVPACSSYGTGALCDTEACKIDGDGDGIWDGDASCTDQFLAIQVPKSDVDSITGVVDLDLFPMVMGTGSNGSTVSKDILGAECSDRWDAVAWEGATLTLAKTVVNDEGGEAVDTDFTLMATGPEVISGVEGDAAITSAVVTVGDYALSESSVPGYTLDNWSCTSGLSGTTVSLAANDVVTCTVTNTDGTPVVDTIFNNGFE